jgi:1,4-dihydroxy-2-naphthoate octaprenyltransferase
MVLGICGLVFSFCCGLIGLVCGILAIVFGNQAKQQITQNPLWAADLGKAKSGVVMGWIAIALSIIVTAASIIFQVSAASLQNLNQ